MKQLIAVRLTNLPYNPDEQSFRIGEAQLSIAAVIAGLRGADGPQGPQGEPGPAGPQGPQGEPADPAVHHRQGQRAQAGARPASGHRAGAPSADQRRPDHHPGT